MALPGGVVDLGHPVGVAVACGVQVDGVGDAVVDDGGEAAGVAEVAAGDRVAQDLVGVVAGDLGLPQYPGQADGAFVRGERRPLGGGERAVVDEAVEHGRGAPGGGLFGDVGEPLARSSPGTAASAASCSACDDRGEVGFGAFGGGGEHAERVGAAGLVDGAGGRVVGARYWVLT